jgi:hypothetical protein
MFDAMVTFSFSFLMLLAFATSPVHPFDPDPSFSGRQADPRNGAEVSPPDLELDSSPPTPTLLLSAPDPGKPFALFS